MAASVFEDLTWRGLIAQSTDPAALRAVLDDGPIALYCGFDPTAPSLEFGNLVQLATMRRLQLAGHRPVAVVGGATGLIGDPSGKSAERMLNPVEVVGRWVARIRTQVERILSFEGENAARIVDNLEWTGELSAIDFLRDIGKHFGVSRMLAKESVSARLDAGGISYTEFSYQILQAYDYLELRRRYACVLQTGGNDQWGNLTAGVDLIRRVDGDDAADEAIAASRALFGDGDLTRLDARTLEAAIAEVPRTTLAPADGLPPLIDLAVACGLFESRGAAKQAIAQGGVYVNNRRMTDSATSLTRDDLLHGRWLLLRRGKRTLAAVELQEATELRTEGS